MKDWLSIGEFSKQTGFSNKALRVYEEKGLLTPHARSESQYRYYHTHQLAQAQAIQKYKDLGFSLDEIKTILSVSCDNSLADIIERRLKESKDVLQEASTQIATLESILTSLKKGQILTTQQRRDVMENILETSLENIKRRGVLPKDNDVAMLSTEIEHLSEALKKTLPEMKALVRFAKDKDILLGPGRGTAPASVILFGEGYSPIYPGKFDLLPELFSKATYIWIDVEYSRYEEVGAMCDAISKKTGIDVVAFRSPIVDIFKDLQNRLGIVDFDKIADTDPMILEAPRNVGVKGLWDLDWNPNFHAFRSMSEEQQKKMWPDQDFFLDWIQAHGIRDADDYLNISYLYYFRGSDGLRRYSEALMKPESRIPELAKNRGMLFYREDWLRIFSARTGLSIQESILVHRALGKNDESSEHFSKIDLLSDAEERNLLKESAGKTFLKSHLVSSWWHYRRTAILKSLWKAPYLEAIDRWEQAHGLIWQEFGYKTEQGSYYLKA